VPGLLDEDAAHGLGGRGHFFAAAAAVPGPGVRGADQAWLTLRALKQHHDTETLELIEPVAAKT
jgi:hypothetical protein